MFFLLRCAFWLTVVFSTIFSTDPSQVTPRGLPESARQAEIARPAEGDANTSAEAMSQTIQAWTSATLQHFWSKTTGSCGAAPTECVALIARLSDFARHHPFEPGTKTAHRIEGKGDAATAALTDAPLPPQRPRHLGHQSRPAERRSAAAG